MELTFAPRGILQINDARIIHRNFRGEGSQFNREGDRNFSLVIETEEMANALTEAGWNVKVKPPKVEGEPPFMFLPVKVKFNDRGPAVYLVSGSRVNELHEETVHRLDEIDILGVNLDIRPYDWTVNGKDGRTAYLQSIEVFQEMDRFAVKHGLDVQYDDMYGED